MIIDNRELIKQFQLLDDNLLVQILVLLILFDILTGIAKAIKNNKLNSHIGLNGMIRHMIIIILVIFTIPYLEFLNLHYLGLGLKLFFIAQYGLSVLENLGELGIKYPKWVKDKLLIMQDQADNIEERKEDKNE